MKKPLAAVSLAIILAAALLMLPGPARCDTPVPDIEGTYDVAGSDPFGGAIYSGRAVLTKRGDGYAFKGVFDDMHYEGVGLYDPRGGILSLSFKGQEKGDMGLTVLAVGEGVLRGRWIFMDDAQGRLGTETWIRR